MTFLVPNKRRAGRFLNYWEPFSQLERLIEKDDTCCPNSAQYFAPINIESDDKTIYVKAELPGLNKEDITVNYHDGLLTISGEKKTEKRDNTDGYHVEEISYGSFNRQITVGDISFDKAKADYKDGVLTLKLPRAESQQAKRLAIN